MKNNKQVFEKPDLKKISGRGGTRPGSGRKAFLPTDKERGEVEIMSGCGLPHEHIATLIRGGIDADTLKKHFKKELSVGKAKANLKIGRTLFQKAIGGDTTAMIWWSKTQMGWKEIQQVDHTSSDGTMTPVALDTSKLSTQSLKELMQAREIKPK